MALDARACGRNAVLLQTKAYEYYPAITLQAFVFSMEVRYEIKLGGGVGVAMATGKEQKNSEGL